MNDNYSIQIVDTLALYTKTMDYTCEYRTTDLFAFENLIKWLLTSQILRIGVST